MERGSEWRRWDLHVHTASSFDYKYHGKDADEKLVDAWRENNISAVTITDHFKIDSDRIINLKELAPDITIFPGVELRTDKGSTNIHVIIIFPEDVDIKILATDFESIMIRQKAKSPERDETIYWDYSDIVEFSNQKRGIISLHAGNKSNGVDEEIKNDESFKMAVKTEFSETVDIYEVRTYKNFEEYNEIVLPQIGMHPVIICSDNHDPLNYEMREKLWIKSDLTFKGLLQAIQQPKERVFIGEEPFKIVHENTEAQYIIDSISIKKNDNAKNEENWFDTNLKLNSSLVSIIGNKGSGKSALSDILGLVGNSLNLTDEVASFLNKSRFNRPSKYLSRDYNSKLTWKDGHIDQTETLELKTLSEAARVQYLPQKYIENVCSNLDDSFQEEINSVLFSYLDDIEKLGTRDFDEFINLKTRKNMLAIDSLKTTLLGINKRIIELEEKKKSEYADHLKQRKIELSEDLNRQLEQKPKVIEKPIDSGNSELTKSIELKESEIDAVQKKITDCKARLEALTRRKNDVETLKSKVEIELARLIEINNEITEHFSQESDTEKYLIKFNSPIEAFNIYIDKMTMEINDLDNLLDKSTKESLTKQEEILVQEKEELIRESTSEIRAYQKYIQDLSEWQEKVDKIKDNKNSNDSLSYIETELLYLENQLDDDYTEAVSKRVETIKSIFREKRNIVDVYGEIYSPIDTELRPILTDLDNGITFSATLTINDSIKTLLDFISKQPTSLFTGIDNANIQMDNLVREIDPNNFDSIDTFIDKLIKGCMGRSIGEDSDFDKLDKVIRNKEDFYSKLFEMDFITVDYSLTLEEKDLSQLSPGERGLVLLIFYLVLSKDRIPIIIDQPEDNLDNQSIYTKLVPCIQEAKKKRQVILVTHNPNIAVACDSEQIIVANIDKVKNEIRYESGSIEDDYLNEQLVNVLEGTFPAFDLRERKYIQIEK